jgi:hypothetical protein
MKMNSKTILGLFLISAMILLGTLASALEIVKNTELDNTTIDYTPYREIVVNSAGVVYQIKITNTGKEDRYYEILPSSDAIRNVGTYRIDPSDKIILQPNQEQIVFIYVTVEKSVSGRIEIPVRIKSGFADTTINLVARPFGPFIQPENGGNRNGVGTVLTTAFKIVFGAMLIILILIGLFFAFRKIRKKKEEETEEDLKPEFEEEVETYY